MLCYGRCEATKGLRMQGNIGRNTSQGNDEYLQNEDKERQRVEV
jgi:hypothetical protein